MPKSVSNESVLMTFLELADNLIDDFDVVELLTFLTIRCVEILDVSNVGVMLVAPEGDLRCVASSSEALPVMELFELQSSEGPSLADFEVAEHVSVAGAEALSGRWPIFGAEVVRAGFTSFHAFPMKLREKPIGTLNIFRKGPGTMSVDDMLAAQALSKFATIIVLHQPVTSEPNPLPLQIASAISERSLVDVAKRTAVAKGDSVDLEVAFAQMRRHALRNNRRMSDVAQEIVDRTQK